MLSIVVAGLHALDGNRPHSLGVAAPSNHMRDKGMLLLTAMEQRVSETVFPNPSLTVLRKVSNIFQVESIVMPCRF